MYHDLFDVDVESCVIFFLCCITGRILLVVFVVRYWSFPPYFLLVLYIGTLRLSEQDIFKEIVKDYLIF